MGRAAPISLSKPKLTSSIAVIRAEMPGLPWQNLPLHAKRIQSAALLGRARFHQTRFIASSCFKYP